MRLGQDFWEGMDEVDLADEVDKENCATLSFAAGLKRLRKL